MLVHQRVLNIGVPMFIPYTSQNEQNTVQGCPPYDPWVCQWKLSNFLSFRYQYPGWWLTYSSEKNVSSSVGMMTFPIYGKMKFIFQTTNKYRMCDLLVGPFFHWICLFFARVSVSESGSCQCHQKISIIAFWDWMGARLIGIVCQMCSS